MLTLRIQQLGDVTIVHCIGRIAFPYVSGLRVALLQQLRTRTLVLDHVDTVAIDAAGLGALVSLSGEQHYSRSERYGSEMIRMLEPSRSGLRKTAYAWSPGDSMRSSNSLSIHPPGGNSIQETRESTTSGA